MNTNKAPDKIYVPQHNIEAGNIQELDELIVAGSTEYIRKDYLLDILYSEKECCKSARERRHFAWVIDKLNEI